MGDSTNEDMIQDLLDMKSTLEKRLVKLNDEKSEIKEQVKAIRDKKENVRKVKASDLQRLYKLRVQLEDTQKQVLSYFAYIEEGNQRLKELEISVQDQMKLIGYEQKMVKICDNVESAIHFFTEDSLQVEYMRRHQVLSDRRVEYTKLEAEILEFVRKLEEKKIAEEQARLVEEERKRQEEERLRKLEEEKASYERARQREHYLKAQRALSPENLANESNQPFLGSGRSLYFSDQKQPSAKSPSKSSTPSTDQAAPDSGEPQKKQSCYGLSQYLKW